MAKTLRKEQMAQDARRVVFPCQEPWPGHPSLWGIRPYSTRICHRTTLHAAELSEVDSVSPSAQNSTGYLSASRLLHIPSASQLRQSHPHCVSIDDTSGRIQLESIPPTAAVCPRVVLSVSCCLCRIAAQCSSNAHQIPQQWMALDPNVTVDLCISILQFIASHPATVPTSRTTRPSPISYYYARYTSITMDLSLFQVRSTCCFGARRGFSGCQLSSETLGIVNQRQKHEDAVATTATVTYGPPPGATTTTPYNAAES